MVFCSVDEYAQVHDTCVFRWSHARARLRSRDESEALDDALRWLIGHPPQVLYANTPAVTSPGPFASLLSLLRLRRTWALNVGEARFSEAQCAELTQAVRESEVAFMFVDVAFVGGAVVRELKDVIRARRRSVRPGSPSPWTLSDDERQNAIIMQCTSMWWAPWSLGRNKSFMKQRH